MSYTSLISDRDYKVIWYKIRGFGLEMNCKMTEYGKNTENYMSTMSFGTGAKKYCIIASYSLNKPSEIYIDRVERKEACVLGRSLNSFEEGTIKLFKIALWTMKQLYPGVIKFTLKGDSQIYCDGEGTKDTMYLSYDYILKYNETWYQKKFNAELPGFISKSATNELPGFISKSATNNITHVISQKDSIMSLVYESFKILDEKITPLPLLSDLLPVLLNYKDEYNTSNTPREFINKLRQKLGKKYCNIVGKWLNGYMSYLKIDIQMDKWYILDKYIIKPDKYSFELYSDKNLYLGGSKLYKSLKRNTRKHSTKNYGITSDTLITKNYIGIYDELA